ncbi:MAG: hypothetical protein KDC70_04415 [Saprospiraceae bacterium]|nr:hypothetical protein [Saprospiraceae bacterium]
MKKKMETLIKRGALEGNAEFESLHTAYETAKAEREQARTAKSVAKTAYQEAIRQGKKNKGELIESLTAFRQAKCMEAYHRAGSQLAKYRLHSWLEDYLKNPPPSPETKKPARKTPPGKATARKKQAATKPAKKTETVR